MANPDDSLTPRAESIDDEAAFDASCKADIEAMKRDADLPAMGRMWARAVAPYRYPYHFKWMGRPVIQVPQDLLAMQELIWEVRPSFIVETGVARGGSLVFYASMLELAGGDGRVVGIDVDIRPHNRRAITSHPMARRIDLVSGSSIDPAVFSEVKRLTAGAGPVIVCLDSHHGRAHVLEELRLYSSLVGRGSYLVVFDTLLELLPASASAGKPWGPGDGPLTAVAEFLRENSRFVVDEDIDAKLQITVAPRGWLRCVGDAS
jgi:cephalosporin hydroxylase